MWTGARASGAATSPLFPLPPGGREAPSLPRLLHVATVLGVAAHDDDNDRAATGVGALHKHFVGVYLCLDFVLRGFKGLGRDGGGGWSGRRAPQPGQLPGIKPGVPPGVSPGHPQSVVGCALGSGGRSRGHGSGRGVATALRHHDCAACAGPRPTPANPAPAPRRPTHHANDAAGNLAGGTAQLVGAAPGEGDGCARKRG